MTLLEHIRKIVPAAGSRLQADVMMTKHTTFHVGGPADLFFEPADCDELIGVVQYCKSNHVPYTIVGNGSNILVSDRGIRGVVVSIDENFAGMECHHDLLVVRAGTRLSAVAAFAAKNGLSGLEFASGIPGTLGGAILMNAGAYEHCMAEIILLTEFLNEKLQRKSLFLQEHEFSYRHSYFSDHESIILNACMRLQPDRPQAIFERMAILASRRKASQPLELPSAGSAFKRPNGYFAGKLISDCGLKGCRIGDAQVSEKHAGFIVNLGMARASDIRNLFQHVQQTVADQTGVHLEPEVRFIGDWQVD